HLGEGRVLQDAEGCGGHLCPLLFRQVRFLRQEALRAGRAGPGRQVRQELQEAMDQGAATVTAETVAGPQRRGRRRLRLVEERRRGGVGGARRFRRRRRKGPVGQGRGGGGGRSGRRQATRVGAA